MCPRCSTLSTTALLVLIEALTFLATTPSGRKAETCDPRSALQRLASSKFGGNTARAHLSSRLIPSYAGADGNIQADKLAVTAHCHPTRFKITSDSGHLGSVLQQFLEAEQLLALRKG